MPKHQTTTVAAYVSAKQLAEHFAVSMNTIWRWSKNGTIPAGTKLGPNTTRWNMQQVKQHVEAQK